MICFSLWLKCVKNIMMTSHCQVHSDQIFANKWTWRIYRAMNMHLKVHVNTYHFVTFKRLGIANSFIVIILPVILFLSGVTVNIFWSDKTPFPYSMLSLCCIISIYHYAIILSLIEKPALRGLRMLPKTNETFPRGTTQYTMNHDHILWREKEELLRCTLPVLV